MFSKEDGLVATPGDQMGDRVLPLPVTPCHLGAVPEAGH